MTAQTKGPRDKKKRVHEKKQYREIQRRAATEGTVESYGNPFEDDTTGFYKTYREEVEGEVVQPEGLHAPPLGKPRKAKESFYAMAKIIALILAILIPVIAATLYISKIDSKVDLVRQSVEELKRSDDRIYEQINEIMRNLGIFKKNERKR